MDIRTNKTPLEDLRKSALIHYEEASNAISHWSSSIPNAINFYFDSLIKNERQTRGQRVIVAGSRGFGDYKQLRQFCDLVIKSESPVIVSGGARGADKLGERYATEKGYEIRQFIPDWSTGRGAGFVRNRNGKIRRYSHCFLGQRKSRNQTYDRAGKEVWIGFTCCIF